MRRSLAVAALAAAFLAPVAARADRAALASPSRAACSSSYVSAHLSWGDKCLRVGQACKVGNSEYHAYGFACLATGHLVAYSGGPTTTTTTNNNTAPALGRTVLLKHRTRTHGCTLGAEPDWRCSPGAYYSKLTKAVICSSSFRTSTIRNVPQSEKEAVEQEYGLAAKLYGRTAARTTSPTSTPRKRSSPTALPASTPRTNSKTSCTRWSATARSRSGQRSDRSLRTGRRST